ncbi:hypothetical protein LOTGIDRAFT_157698 [Lottia gigantea]|uniref:Uncharacterized protein n=1 Tax=Lottia gigantea TaxID=225164 RepID=V4AZE9_LOTGI|nr:hypothetical protein LOTGIDRAFT_157698 [Lottia gigantea]ESP00491.1 hypothetical protein LOTGIDRAFT_157698 [Lottia gigantea]
MKLTVLFGVLVICVALQMVHGLVVGLGGMGGIGIGGVGLGGLGVGLGGVGVGLGGVGVGMGGVGVGLDALDGLVLGGITGCRCMAVDRNNAAVVLRDFGIIQACSALSLCGCNEIGVRSCRRVCERVVEVWADNVCPLALRDTEVKAAFQSTLCAAGLGDGTNACDGNGLTGVVVPFLPNLVL